MDRLVVIGGSDAGISAALRSLELRPDMEVTVLVSDRFPNFSICGLPFLLSGEVTDWRSLAHRTREELEATGMRLRLGCKARSVDATRRTVTVSDADGGNFDLPYDRLILATGALSVKPPVEGLDLPGVFFLRWMEDGLACLNFLKERSPRSAAVIGSGYIGLETADALTRRGIQVTLIQRSGTLRKTLDPSLSRLVDEELEKHGVRPVQGMTPKGVERSGERLVVLDERNRRVEADMVLVAVGARPNSELAAQAGADLGAAKAVRVNRRMETGLPGVYAAGDCVEAYHRILEKPVYLPLGTTAHKQGRVAGENAAGGAREFAGSLGTQVVQVFDLVAARTGLMESEASVAGWRPLTVETECPDHKAYYPGARNLQIRLTGDRETGRLLGVQLLGRRESEIAKRIDVFAACLFHGMDVEALNDLDLSYTPPLGAPWDPAQAAAQAWGSARKMRKA